MRGGRPELAAVKCTEAVRGPGAAEGAGVRLRLTARVAPEAISWRVVQGPCFDNHVGLLELDGRAAGLRVERAVAGGDGAAPARLELLYEQRLAGGPGDP